MAIPNFFNPYGGRGSSFSFGDYTNGSGFSLLAGSGTAARGAASTGFVPTSSFTTNLKNPTLTSVGGAAVSALPGILSGNYPQAAAAAAGSYTGSAIGSSAAVALGLSGGPVTIAAMIGGLAVSTLAGSFFKSQPQRHSAGANLQVENGLASFQSSGQDRANTQFVDEFINFVSQGANEVLTSYGLKLPDTPGRRLTGNGNTGQTVGNQYRLAVEDLGRDGQARTLAVIGPDEARQTFSGQNQAQEAYEYAVTALLNSVPGFQEAINQSRSDTPGGTGPEIITPGQSTTPRADQEQPIALPPELEYRPESIPFPRELQYDPASFRGQGGGGGPTIISLGAAPTELKPQAQQAFYRQRRASVIDQRRSRGIRTNPRGLRRPASTARTILSGA